MIIGRRGVAAGMAGTIAMPALAAPVGREKPYQVALFTYAQQDELMALIRRQFAARGYEAGRNITFTERSGKRDHHATERYAAELGAGGYDLVVAMMTSAAVEMRKTTQQSRTPVVFWSAEPVESGIVDSFAQVGGNLTGVTVPVDGQLLQLRFLKLVVPGLKRVGFLYNPDYGPAPAQLRELQGAARLFELELPVYEVRTMPQVEQALAQMQTDGLKACVTGPHELFNTNGETIGGLAVQHGLAAVSFTESLVRGGALACYGPDFGRVWPRAVEMACQILEGAAVTSLPVDRKIQLRNLVNHGAARKLGLTIPESLLAEADRVLT